MTVAEDFKDFEHRDSDCPICKGIDYAVDEFVDTYVRHIYGSGIVTRFKEALKKTVAH